MANRNSKRGDYVLLAAVCLVTVAGIVLLNVPGLITGIIGFAFIVAWFKFRDGR